MFRKKIFTSALIFSLLFSLVGLKQNVFASGTDLQIGAWPGAQPTENNIKDLQTLQQRKLDFVQTFINWSTNFEKIKTCADATYSNGSTLMVTWEPWEYNTVQIKNGNVDSYIIKMANDMKAYNKEIWLRPLHEGNGNWYPWAIGDSTVNTNETYIAAYRHIVDIFRAQGATNVKWVFNINCSNVGQGTSFTNHYPGDAYVDYNSLDGYNWGTTQSWGSAWQTFDGIFLSGYNALKQYNKPIMLAEVASAEMGGDKAKWITDSFSTIKASYDKIFALMWFNEKKETDWLINSSPESLNAYIKAISVSSTSQGTVGDINNDGKINIIDYLALKKYIAGLWLGKTPDMAIWDLNGDEKINIFDMIKLKLYLSGKITSFIK